MTRGPSLPPSDKPTPAVVLKLDPNVFHHGGLGVIRTLGRLGVPVHAVEEAAFTPAAASRYLHGRWRWTPAADRPDEVLAGLRRMAERLGRPAVLIPTDDAGAIFLAGHAVELRGSYLFPEPEPALVRGLADKHALADLTRGTAIPSPETVRPASPGEALEFAERVGLPVFAKLATPWDPPPVRPLSTTRLSTADEVAGYFRRFPGASVLQEAVTGGTDWVFHGYCDRDSVLRAGFTGIKERSYPPYHGLTTLGRTAPNERLRADVERFLRAVNYRGILDLDLRWDPRRECYRLLDFNPRVGAQFRLFQDAAGIDVVRAAYLDLTGQPVTATVSVPSRRLLVENYDPFAALGYARRHELSLRAWLASLRGVSETAWFARDDLAPFAVMCLRFGWRAVERPFRRTTRPGDRPTPAYRRGRAGRGGVKAVPADPAPERRA